jgi:hypothetical protein
MGSDMDGMPKQQRYPRGMSESDTQALNEAVAEHQRFVEAEERKRKGK